MPDQKFRISRRFNESAAVLAVRSQRLEMEDLFTFQAACVELMESDQPNLIIDAQGLKAITSVFIGTVIKTSVEAKSTGQQLAINTNPEVARLFRQLLGEDIVEIRESES